MIDPRAVIDPKAELDSDVTVGAYTIIGAHVTVGAGTWIAPHVVIQGPSRIGCNNKIYQFASLGEDPQDKKYHGETDSRLEIGDSNTMREYCTMNRGTHTGGGVTRLGDNNWIMAYTHIAHDCLIGNHTIFANGASLAGHVRIDDYVNLGGFSLVHQFCALGIHSFSGANSLIFKDVPPYVMVWGNRAKAFGINKEGLKRRGFSTETIQALHRAYKVIYKQNLTTKQAIAILQTQVVDCPEIAHLIDFLQQATRGIVR